MEKNYEKKKTVICLSIFFISLENGQLITYFNYTRLSLNPEQQAIARKISWRKVYSIH